VLFRSEEKPDIRALPFSFVEPDTSNLFVPLGATPIPMLLDESWEMPSVKSPVENVLPIYYLFSNCVMRVCRDCIVACCSWIAFVNIGIILV